MARRHLTSEIENRASTDIQIAPELAEVVELLCDNGIHAPEDTWIKTEALVAASPEATYNRIERLVDMGFIDKRRSGPTRYIIHERLDEIINGEDVEKITRDELRRVHDHAKSDPRIRWIVAGALGVSPGRIGTVLYDEGFLDLRQRLENVITAIQEAPLATQGAYGNIVFRRSQNQYQASARAVRLHAK